MAGRLGRRALHGGLLGLALIVVACGGGESAPAGEDPAATFLRVAPKGYEAQSAGDFEQAEEHYRAALDELGSLDAETRRREMVAIWTAVSSNGLAEAMQSRGASLEAIGLIERAENEIDGLPDAFRAMLASMLGQLLVDVGLPGRAEEPMDRALALARPRSGAEPNYGVLFNAHARQVRRLNAAGLGRAAVAAAEACWSEYPWAGLERTSAKRHAKNRDTLHLLTGIAWMLLAHDDPDAEELARESFEQVGPGADPIDRFAARGRLVHLDLRRGELGDAGARLRELRSEVEASAFGLLSPRETAWLASLEMRAAELSGEGLDAARARLEAAFADVLEGWRRDSRPGGTGFLRYARARFLLEQLVATATPERGLELLVAASTQGVLWEALGRPEPSIEEIRDALTAESTGCLIFLLGVDRTFLFTVDAGGVERHELGSPDPIDDHARELTSALRQAPGSLTPRAAKRRRSRIDEHGAALASSLLPDALEGWLAEHHHLRIVGADLLQGLAFEALPFADSRLGRRKALSYLPSLPVGVALAARRPSGEGVRLLAAPTLDDDVEGRFPSLEPIVLDDAALGPLLDALGPIGADVLRGPRATASALASARADGVGQAHVIAHGVQDLTRELRPVLLLAPDDRSPTGEVRVEDVRGFEATDLVFLSSCRAGRGGERMGDAGSAHLGGAFLQAGSRCVVLSGEDVRLGAALALAEAFHRARNAGASTAEALRVARDGMAGAGYDDPYDWALTYAFGLDDVE